MSYILNSDGKSELLDASYIIVPQNDSLFAIVKNNNVTDLKELTIEEFLTSELFWLQDRLLRGTTASSFLFRNIQ